MYMFWRYEKPICGFNQNHFLFALKFPTKFSLMETDKEQIAFRVSAV